jgi:hypothetical protein
MGGKRLLGMCGLGAFVPLCDGRDPATKESTLNMQFDPGDLYEDCAYHPCLCVGVSVADDEIWGISLIDGSYPRSCSLNHCDVRKVGVEEAWEIKQRYIRRNGQDGWWEPAQPE